MLSVVHQSRRTPRIDNCVIPLMLQHVHQQKAIFMLPNPFSASASKCADQCMLIAFNAHHAPKDDLFECCSPSWSPWHEQAWGPDTCLASRTAASLLVLGICCNCRAFIVNLRSIAALQAVQGSMSPSDTQPSSMGATGWKQAIATGARACRQTTKYLPDE